MDDPTIFEILSSLQNAKIYLLASEHIAAGKKIEDILEQDWYKKEESKLKKDIAKGRLKAVPLSYFVMTINMNGQSLGQGTADNRRLLLTILLRNFPCSVILSQENHGRLIEEIAECYELEGRKNGKEAAIIWDGNDFEGTDEGLKSSDARITKIRDKIESQLNELGLMSELLSRIKMVKLTCRTGESENPSFLAVSWHGPWIGHDVHQKHKIFQGLQNFVQKVSEKEGNIPYIIGGDFNLNTLDEPLPVSVGAVVSSYPLTPRAQEFSDKKSRLYKPKYVPYKDNFIFSRYGICVKWARPLDFTSRSEQTQAANDFSRKEQDEVQGMPVDSSRGVVDDLLDHDPVVGVLQLSNTSAVVQNLGEKFKALEVKSSN